MKLFALLAGALGLAHAAEEVASADGYQSLSGADKKVWKDDVIHAASTLKQVKNNSCKLPKGKSLKKLGDPHKVNKHYYKLSNGNTRATYQFKFKDGTTVYAGNSNVGEKGGNWKVYCYRQGNTVVTNGAHSHDLSSENVGKLRKIFKSIDKDGSGTITTGGAYTGLAQVFSANSLPNFESTLEKESIRAAGKDKVVDLDEFECVAKKLSNIKKVYDEFKHCGKNHDLKMSRKELESALIKFYFKDVAKPGLIQTATMRAKVKKTVDDIIKRHDKNNDSTVSWNEFEMDAFMEEHYKLGDKCKTSKTPLNKHEITVVQNLIKKFKGNTKKNEMSHSMWYQVTSMLTEQAIDLVNGPAKPPALGCMHKKKPGQDNGPPKHRFGENGGKNFGEEPKPFNDFGDTLNVDDGMLGGRRVLLARFLQEKMPKDGQKPKQQKPGKDGDLSSKERMTIMQALQALHKQADKNNDGKISDHEILDIFQGVRNHLSASDFGAFLDLVNKLKGPVNCGKSNDCGKCTAVGNAGLCGWFAESQKSSGNVFGGLTQQKSKGNCKFVDRSMSAEQNADDFKVTTCSTQCKKQKNPRFRPGKKGGDGKKPNNKNNGPNNNQRRPQLRI